jgi:hypothetical protein
MVTDGEHVDEMEWHAGLQLAQARDTNPAGPRTKSRKKSATGPPYGVGLVGFAAFDFHKLAFARINYLPLGSRDPQFGHPFRDSQKVLHGEHSRSRALDWVARLRAHPSGSTSESKILEAYNWYGVNNWSSLTFDHPVPGSHMIAARGSVRLIFSVTQAPPAVVYNLAARRASRHRPSPAPCRRSRLRPTGIDIRFLWAESGIPASSPSCSAHPVEFDRFFRH